MVSDTEPPCVGVGVIAVVVADKYLSPAMPVTPLGPVAPYPVAPVPPVYPVGPRRPP